MGVKMVSQIMKRAVVAMAETQKEAATAVQVKPHRSALLGGVENVERWLREEIAATIFSVSDSTVVDYMKKAARLNAVRPRDGEPPDINALTNKATTFYAYRAALRYDACQRGKAALRAYNKAGKGKDAAAKSFAYAALLEAAADLKAYPRDAQPGLPNPVHVKLGLADKKQKSAFAKDLTKAVVSRDTSKLKAANRIQKIDGWREKIFARLAEVKSPWLTCAAVAALTGVRPDELNGIIIERRNGALRFTVNGSKVSEHKGQPQRWLTVSDSGPEFLHLWALTAVPYTVEVPNLKNPKDAFSAALARAGVQAFGDTAPRMSGYVYRHALTSDLKADGFSPEQISATLGHSVSRTASYYGRAIGGKTGVRQLVAEVPRAIKMNHSNRYAESKAPSQQADVEIFNTPGWSL